MALAPGQLFDPATFSPEQAALLTNTPGQSLATSNAPGTVAKAMSLSPNVPASYVNPATPVSLPTGGATTDYRSLLAGTAGSLPAGNVTGTGAGSKTPEQIAVEKSQADIIAGMQDLQGEDAYAASLQDSLGITQGNKELKDLQSQLVAINNEAAANTLNVDRQGRPTVLTAEANIEKGNIERDRTIKALRLSSSIQAIQGNLELANDQLDRSVKLKYEPIKNKLEILNKQLEFNYETFTASEKKRADALKLENDIKLKQIDAQVDIDKAWGTLRNAALANSAPVGLVNQAEAARASGDENTARALLAPYTGTKNYNSSGDPKTTFTTSQVNSGAAAAGIPIEQFKALDEDTKNFFVNRKADFQAQKDAILEAKDLEEDPLALEDQIRGMNMPVFAQEQLIKYLETVFAKELAAAASEPEKKSGGSGEPWWKGFLGLNDFGFFKK